MVPVKGIFGKIVGTLTALLGLMVLFGAGYLYLTPTPQGFPILEYHMVCSGEIEPEETAYNVPPEDFREELAYLQREGYTTISLLEYMKAKRGKLTLPEKPIVLTFDDGYADNYYEMLPIIEEYGMKATVYMVTNNIGQPRYLTWDELRDMQRRGIEIGSHTANHIPLTALSPEDRRDEVYLSKLLMEWNGIDTVFSLSYPNGAYDDTLPELLKENEYLTAVTGDGGLNTMETNPYLLQRVNIPCPHFGLTEFKFRLWKAEAMAKLGIWQHRER